MSLAHRSTNRKGRSVRKLVFKGDVSWRGAQHQTGDCRHRHLLEAIYGVRRIVQDFHGMGECLEAVRGWLGSPLPERRSQQHAQDGAATEALICDVEARL